MEIKEAVMERFDSDEKENLLVGPQDKKTSTSPKQPSAASIHGQPVSGIMFRHAPQ